MLLLVGCYTQPRREEPREEQPRLVTTKQFVTAVGVRRAVGESCATGGASECQEGFVCLHTQPHPDEGWFCSKRCEDVRDCPGGAAGAWTCGEYYPGHRACAPPAGWVARAVTAEVPR